MTIKTGLVGLGTSGRLFHLPFLGTNDAYDIRMIVSRQPDLAATLAPGAVCVSSSETLLDSDVDLVVLCVPNVEHLPLASRALRAGKHVVLEKPLVTSSAAGRELIDIADAGRRVLSVYHNRRWDGDFLTVKGLIDSGELGNVVTFESHFDRFRPKVRQRWRESPLPGSGSLFDLGSHLIDQALVLFGDPRTVTAQVLCQRAGAQVDDYFQVTLDYETLQVLLRSSALAAEPGPRFRVRGSDASYLVGGMDPQEGQLADGMRPDDPAFGRVPEERFGRLYTGDPDGRRIPTLRGCYPDYYERLASCIERGGPNPVSANEGLRVIRLIELAMESQRTGRRMPIAARESA